jgi:hypothetical protein
MDEEKEYGQGEAGYTPEEGEPIRIDEDDLKNAQKSEAGSGTWTEEFTVAGEELVDTVRRLAREVGVRRIVIKNEEKRILFEIPLFLGIAGIAFLPIYASVALIAALVADCTIAVERVAED